MAALSLAFVAGLLPAQRGGGRQAAPPQPVVTFAALSQAVEQQDYTVEQLRRFVDGQGQVTSVREQVRVDADGTASPPFLVSFVGVEGQLPGSPAHLEWQDTYDRYGPLFHKHGSFAVRDLAKVRQNYSLHEFGAVVRAGRAAVRTVVFPATADKSIWVVDVDLTTKVPLYWAEFDFQLQLLAEVEVVAFLDSVIMPAMSVPSLSVSHGSFAAAKTWMGDPKGLLETPATLAGYGVSQVETRDDPLNGQKKLVMTYTDGVDEFLISEVPSTSNPFDGLAAKTAGSTSLGHTIARFRDPTMRVLLFWEDGVSFQVAGRGSLDRLDQVARQVYVDALAN